MKQIKYLLFTILAFVCITTSANALTKVELVGDSEIEYGSLVTYQIKVSTDELVEGFQFDLDYDSNLTYVTIQSSMENLIVKISDDKDKVIGYGTTISDGDIVATIIFQTAQFSETTSVNIKLSNEIYTTENLATVKNTDEIMTTTKVVVPEVEVTTTSTTTSSNTTTSNDDKEDDAEKPAGDKVLADDTEKESGVTKVIKIVIIILLGAFILYLLNKEEKTEDEVAKEENKEEKAKEPKAKKAEVNSKETKKAKK